MFSLVPIQKPRLSVKVNYDYDDYEVSNDTETVDDSIHEHLQSRTTAPNSNNSNEYRTVETLAIITCKRIRERI